MDILKHQSQTSLVTKSLLLMGLLLLALEPFLWLINTWQDHSYDSMGFWAFLATLLILLWSALSPLKTEAIKYPQIAIILLLATSLVRLLGQVFAINVIGALALVIDIYAIALLLSVAQRKRAISPAWLAILFIFTLPIERIIQRVIGYGLQELSSHSACSILQLTTDNVICNGTRIAVAGRQFLIDLPCSGSNTLVILAIVMTIGMILARPSTKQGIYAVITVLISAWLSNVIRILLLVLGSTSNTLRATGIDVMAQPWHDVVGLVALLPFLWIIFSFSHKVAIDSTHQISTEKFSTNKPTLSLSRYPKLSLFLALIFIAFAITTINLPRHAIDAQKTSDIINLPTMLQGEYGHPVALLEKEKAYFTQFGGDARKAIYGERQLLLTKTSSPLRHLHSPDECLRGLGFKVSYLGTIDQPIATAIYKATSPDGQVWKIAVSFISSDGKHATNVSEAVWQWLKHPNNQSRPDWYSLQRISPWHTSFDDDRQWDRSVLNAMMESFYEK